jgi:DNA-binding NarL/FixJ family response regulator
MTHTVLMVNNNAWERTCISQLLALSNKSIVVHAASNWNEAAELLAKNTYNCALLSYRLPQDSGIAIFRRLYDEKTGMSSVPIILTSQKEDKRALTHALHCGAQDYLLTDVLTTDLLAESVCNNINAHKVALLAKYIEDKVRGGRILEQMTIALIDDLKQFRESLSHNVTDTDARDADVR